MQMGRKFVTFLLSVSVANAFVSTTSSSFVRSNHRNKLEFVTTRKQRTSREPPSQLSASHGINPAVEKRRKELLSRNGSHFKVEPFSGKIEFGAATTLVTRLLERPDAEAVNTWLQDGRGLASSIWDEKLMKDLGENRYRLEIMTLQFVTIQLAPWVEVEMKTELIDDKPVFKLQSYSFEPNVKLLPGLRVTAKSLGIVIEVAGELRPTANCMGVQGKISFQTTGILPPPLRLTPEAALKVAANGINKTIINFATRSFERGAKKKFDEFCQRQEQQNVR